MYEPLRRVERSIPGIPLIASSALLCCGALSLSVDASLRHTTMALFVSIFDPSVKQKYVDLLAICLDLLAIWGQGPSGPSESRMNSLARRLSGKDFRLKLRKLVQTDEIFAVRARIFGDPDPNVPEPAGAEVRQLNASKKCFADCSNPMRCPKIDSAAAARRSETYAVPECSHHLLARSCFAR